MSEVPTTSYDEVPYSDNVFSYTHPDCLATVAILHGMNPAPVDRCRVLELGCGTGSNLIPMAQDLPGSHFVGIDLSARQIESGRRLVADLGLGNIELRALSILDVDESFGRFDYIICHGVYSWVPPEVQDKILAVCKANLTPEGIAYVSYNTYPGWHIRGMIRQMMGFHVKQFDDPHERVRQARALLDFLAKAAGGRNSVYGSLFQIESDLLKGASDTYIYHEHLEEVNSPVYFHEFAARAATKGLQYIAEARPSLLMQNLSREACETLERISPSLIHLEQYLDFVRNRTFRRTLLCHNEVRLQRPPSRQRLTELYLTGLARPSGGDPAGEEEFRTVDGISFTTGDARLKTALRALYDAWPGSLPFGELAERAGTAGDPEPLAEMMLQCYLACIVELHPQSARFVTEPGERPRTTPLARLQARRGGLVFNRRHRSVELEPFDRLVLRGLDGTRDRAALIEALLTAAAEGEFEIQHDGQAVPDSPQLREALGQALEASLQRLAGSALLIG